MIEAYFDMSSSKPPNVLVQSKTGTKSTKASSLLLASHHTTLWFCRGRQQYAKLHKAGPTTTRSRIQVMCVFQKGVTLETFAYYLLF